jgi:hypothetical protein
MNAQGDLAVLRAENARLIALLDMHGIAWRLPAEPAVPLAVEPPRPTADEKVALFQQTVSRPR